MVHASKGKWQSVWIQFRIRIGQKYIQSKLINKINMNSSQNNINQIVITKVMQKFPCIPLFSR